MNQDQKDNLKEQYSEAFNRPTGSITLLTKKEAEFIRAVMRCNQKNKNYWTQNEDRTIQKPN